MSRIRTTEIKFADMKLPGYTILAYWGPRQETPASVATRFLNLIDRLAPIDPIFGNWIGALNRKPVKLDAIRKDMTQFVEHHVAKDDDGDPDPHRGYIFTFGNTLDAQPRSLDIGVDAGYWAPPPYGEYYFNTAVIKTCYQVTPDPEFLRFPIFRSAILALGETFDATWCRAYPDNFPDSREAGLLSRSGWMNYVSPRFAPLVMPPATAIVEYRPDGGLLMTATRDTFVSANPQHVAVARDIAAALAPLDALPWPPDAEPDSSDKTD